MPEAPIETTGTILDHKGGILYRVELANGKVVLGHLSKPLTKAAAEPGAGTVVLLEMTPFDFDQGRITAIMPS